MVSVLFCDLVGFTAASESADPEEVQARIAPYHARTRERIEAFGGTVEKFIGDAVMAVFGAPDGARGRSGAGGAGGLALLEAIEELNAADGSLALSVRVGVNTGEAVVALDARPELGEGMVTGDVVNTAARIQSQAPVNGVAVGEGTFRATERVFEYEPLDPIDAKGKAEPVAVWRALRPTARFGSDVIRSMTTPLVGRELDFTLLRGTFDKAVAERSVQLVTVAGEPGVGKSRLVAELFAYTDGWTSWSRGGRAAACPYGEGITFWALGEIVKAHAGIFESDPPEVATAKLDAVLPESDDRPWLRARLLPLLGIDAGEPAAQEELFTAWRRFLEIGGGAAPLVLVVEDLHWADQALLAFLEHLADWAQGVPLLVVCTARPELYETHAGLGHGAAQPHDDQPLAAVRHGDGEARLRPAGAGGAARRRRSSSCSSGPAATRCTRRSSCGCCATATARRARRSRAEVPFPESIQALIAARLDTLPPERKTLLQDAAVLGKVFWAGAVAAMGDRDPARGRARAARALPQGARAARPASRRWRARAEYGFWHVLVRDVAYEQIPRAAVLRSTLAAAEWLESKAGERRGPRRGARLPHGRGARPRPGNRRHHPRGRGHTSCGAATRCSPVSVRSASTRPGRWSCSTARRRSRPRRIPPSRSFFCAGPWRPARPAACPRPSTRSSRRSSASRLPATCRTPVRRCRALERSLEPRRAGFDRHRRASGQRCSKPIPGRELVDAVSRVASSQYISGKLRGGRRDGRPCARARRRARPGRARRRSGDSRFLTLLHRRPRGARRHGAWFRRAGGRRAGAERGDAAAQPRLRPLVPGRPGEWGRDARGGAGFLGRTRPGRVGADPQGELLSVSRRQRPA